MTALERQLREQIAAARKAAYMQADQAFAAASLRLDELVKTPAFQTVASYYVHTPAAVADTVKNMTRMQKEALAAMLRVSPAGKEVKVPAVYKRMVEAGVLPDNPKSLTYLRGVFTSMRRAGLVYRVSRGMYRTRVDGEDPVLSSFACSVKEGKV